MKVEFRPARIPKELRSLILFDHKAFAAYPSDWFESAHWRTYQPWWLILNHRKVGCCAFEPNVDFQGDAADGNQTPQRKGSLYIASTAISPSVQAKGLGSLFKAWQISYARLHGFTRIVTNTRKSNKPMLRLNQKFGFKTIRTIPHYYVDPPESTVVLELRLGRR
jgi:ribosomal protein S18 acetylase RimI-like enzyme